MGCFCPGEQTTGKRQKQNDWDVVHKHPCHLGAAGRSAQSAILDTGCASYVMDESLRSRAADWFLVVFIVLPANFSPQEFFFCSALCFFTSAAFFLLPPLLCLPWRWVICQIFVMFRFLCWRSFRCLFASNTVEWDFMLRHMQPVI